MYDDEMPDAMIIPEICDADYKDAWCDRGCRYILSGRGNGQGNSRTGLGARKRWCNERELRTEGYWRTGQLGAAALARVNYIDVSLTCSLSRHSPGPDANIGCV